MPPFSSKAITIKERVLAFFLPTPFVANDIHRVENSCLFMIQGKNAFHLNPDNPHLFRVQCQPQQWDEKKIRDGKIHFYFKHQSKWLKISNENIMMIDSVHHEIVLVVKT